MPLLSLSCSCGHRWEALKTFSTADPTVDACPKCGKASPNRVYDSPGIHAKGYDYDAIERGDTPDARLERQAALEHKAWLERVSNDGTRDNFQVKEVGPAWARPEYRSKYL